MTRPKGTPRVAGTEDVHDPVVEAILAVVLERTAIDFSGYRAATVRRRIQSRMLTLGVDALDQYHARLAASPDEADRLLERLTVQVSRFYRNAQVFDRLRADVVPDLLRRGGLLRVWCAGCARGEEAYTLAMIVDEAGGRPDVLATDVVPAALSAARAGLFAPEALRELPAGLRERYVVSAGEPFSPRVKIVDRVRHAVRFARHDLLSGAGPAGPRRFQVISCRNVLIYLQPDAQRRVLHLLGEQLAPGGYLCLGEAEWPPTECEASWEVVSRNQRLFRARQSRPQQGVK